METAGRSLELFHRRSKGPLPCADGRSLVGTHDLAFPEADRQSDLQIEEHPHVVLVRCITSRDSAG